MCADEPLRLVALRPIDAGDEVTVSYIGEGALLRSTLHRRQLLKRWGFTCSCERCIGLDETRGFRCGSCGKQDAYFYPRGDTNSWAPCCTCGIEAPPGLEAAEALWAERERVARDAHAAAFYDGLLSGAAEDPASAPAPDAHWIAWTFGRRAMPALLKNNGAAALLAAQRQRNFANKVLGNAASVANVEALSTEAAVASQAEKQTLARALLDAALVEVMCLPRTAEEVVDRLQRERLELQESNSQDEDTAVRKIDGAALSALAQSLTVHRELVEA